jgi:hypothetical protein
MDAHPLPTEQLVSPAQVWTCLTTDLQARAIRLMAQLALNLVAVPDERPPKESEHAALTHRSQTPA